MFFETEKRGSKNHKITTNPPRKNHLNTTQKHPLFSKPLQKRHSGGRKNYRVIGKMVEAAGVEPASERASNREPSCFFQFVFVSSSTLRTDKDAATTSLINLVFHRADGAGKTSLLCDDRYRPVGEA